MKKLGLALIAFLVSALWLSAGDVEKASTSSQTGPTRAVCVLHPTKGSKVHGVVTLTMHGNEIEIAGEIHDLKPGMHAFHVHEFGDCSSDDGMSTGAHYNPDKKPHAGPHAAERHVGDLGNIKADENGTATIKITDDQIKLSGPHSVVGRALIVHADPDDLKSQPAGNAGARIACGVIGVAKGEAAATAK